MALVDRSVRILFASVVALGLAACGGGDDSNEELGQGSPPVPGDSAVLSTTEPAQLDDAHIAAFLAAADTAEIAPSMLAQENAQNPEVIQFAAMMVRDHGMLSDSLRALTQAQGIVPGDNRESELLRTQTQSTLQSLRAQSGTAFDSAYVSAMIQSHEAVLNAIDGQLLPGARNPRLRAAIQENVRPTVAAHLEQIQQIQSTMTTP